MDPSITEYLERLDARLDAYTNAIRSLAEKLGAHVVSPAVVVQTPPPPTTSPASTTDVSAPVPDVFCSITKVQEIPTVAHDAAPVCIAVVPVTCSTECSTQVNTIDEVHNATTAVDLEPTVDPIHQAVEQISSVQELEALSVDTSTQVISKADHDVAPIIIPVPAVAFQPALDTTAHVAKGLGSDPDDTNAELTHTVTPLKSHLSSLPWRCVAHATVLSPLTSTFPPRRHSPGRQCGPAPTPTPLNLHRHPHTRMHKRYWSYYLGCLTSLKLR